MRPVMRSGAGAGAGSGAGAGGLVLALAAAIGAGALIAPASGARTVLPSGGSGTAGRDGSVMSAQAADCPTSLDAERLLDAARLLQLNRRMYRFGPRPTASPNHRRFVDWVAKRVGDLPGMRLRSIPHRIDRQLTRGVALAAGPGRGAGRPLRASGAVPYSETTSRRGVAGRLVYVPPGEPLQEREVAGRIVIRDAIPGSIPNAAFLALQWSSYDPDLSLTTSIAENYERDFVAYLDRVAELEEAAEAGAAGLVFVHGFPRPQVRGHYAPYEGVRWEVPALYVGVDEGERLKRLAKRGGWARLSHSASLEPARTRTLVATLPGISEERIAITSHTDGINAVWDNGPIAMLAMAEHFAALPRECRPRTLEFAFTTAHLYLQLDPPKREGGAGKYAAELDEAYDEGTAAFAMALEHLGAREYAAVPRQGDKPGRRIELTGLTEPNSFFTGESPVLVEAITESIVRNDLRRSIVLRGADLPGPHFPPHHSFGGEGTAYHLELLPTIAFVTGPWSLYNPSFGMESLDGDLMRQQLVVFTDLVYSLDETPREAIAGGYVAERGARGLLCELSTDGFGLVGCPGEAMAGGD